MSGKSPTLTIIPHDAEPAQSIVDILFKHEERIRDIESGMDKLNDLTKNTNHHLSNMRISLQMLKPITVSVEEIAEAAQANKEEIGLQKKSHEDHRNAVELNMTKINKDVHYMKEMVDGIGPWIRWGVMLMVGMTGIFFTASTALKIFD